MALHFFAIEFDLSEPHDQRRDGKYKGTANILRKYLGDYLIASYLDIVQESGYDDAYVKEIEVTFVLHYLCDGLDLHIYLGDGLVFTMM